jgi:hypothetical protein
VFVDGTLVPAGGYAIDYQRGMLRITEPVRSNAKVRVAYVHLPFLLNSVYSLRAISFAEIEEPAAVPQSRVVRPRPSPPAPGLEFGGMKSVSFSTGSNQGTSLDQTLKATIRGNITPSIQVNALLSDENLPIQPEGNTEELEYLDKVYMEIASERARVSLGDFTLKNDYSTFSPLTREVMGVSGEATVSKSKVLLAGTSSKGVFRTVSFRGTEGLQGPYELLSQVRVSLEVIIAGTERVYMDGELLLRGQNRDYTIDYDRGTITFTPRRLVTPDSEIAVDFEVTQENYDRSAVFTGTESEDIPGALKFQMLYARERDDATRPKGTGLTDQERKILEAAGDNSALATESGITLVAPGAGTYVRVPEDTLMGVPEHFVFNDSTGNYLLTFTAVGAGAGEYILDGISKKGLPVYRFEGLRRGEYSVGKRLPLPESHELVTLRLRRNRDENVTFDLEYNLSNYDRNILSPIGDGDNTGSAGSFAAGIRRIGLGPGALGLSAKVTTIEEAFKSFDKTRPSYFYRDWNLENDRLLGREVLSEAAAAYRAGRALSAGYSFGRLDRDNFKGNKHEGTFSYGAGSDRNVLGRVFSTDMEGSGETRTRRHEAVSLAAGVWRVVPTASISDERFLKNARSAADSGIAFRLYSVGLNSRKGKTLAYSLSYENRDTEELGDTTGGWIDSRRNRTLSFSLSSRALSHVQGEVQYTHRTERNFVFHDERASDLARLKATGQVSSIDLRSDVDYEISQNQSRTLQKNVILVGEGLGDYNVLGEPVGKGRGAYMLVFLPTANLIPVHGVDFTLRLSIGKGLGRRETEAGGAWSWLKRNISLDQTLNVQEETTYDKPWKVYLLVPSALQRNNTTLYGVTSLRQDWGLLNGYKNVSLVYRYQRTDEEDNLYQGAGEDRLSAQHALKLDRSISHTFTATVEVRRESRVRSGSNLVPGSGSAYDATEWAVAAGGGVRFSAGSTIDGLFELSTRKDAISHFEERVASVKPRFVLRLLKTTSLFGTYEFARTLETPGTGVRPIFFSGEGNAQRWSLTGNASLSKVISLVTTYFGRSEKSFTGARIVEHNLKVETRAYF